MGQIPGIEAEERIRSVLPAPGNMRLLDQSIRPQDEKDMILVDRQGNKRDGKVTPVIIPK